jgi:hypothetical protein
MMHDGSLFWLLTAAGLGTALGWTCVKHFAGDGQRPLFHVYVPGAEMAAPAKVSPIAVALMVVLVALDAVAIGALAWATLRLAGPENIQGAAVPLACLAGASVIVALALGPVLEAIFERREIQARLALEQGETLPESPAPSIELQAPTSAPASRRAA